MRYFFQGLLFIAPLAVTALILYSLFLFIDNLLRDILEPIFGKITTGIGFLMMILALILIGYFAQTFIGKPFKAWFDRLLSKIPVLNILYSAFSDLFTSILGTEKKFNRPVLVMVNPDANLEKLGFLTEEDLSFLGEKDKVAVYFPHSYNFSGELFIVPSHQVRVVALHSADVMKFIVSGGVSGFAHKKIAGKSGK